MATQEEVLEAIRIKGYADLKDLKQHFGIANNGSSWLPQRLRALERKKLIVSMRSGNISVYIVNDDCDWEEAKQILLEWGLIRRKRSCKYNEDAIKKLLKFIRENKIVTARQVQEAMGWNWGTTMKYITKLINDGLIFEVRTGKRKLYTTYLI